MNLPHNDELLSAYLDRELSPDERAAVDRWLEQSPETRDQLRELEATSRFLRKLPKHEISTDFADAVVDRLRSESLLRPAPEPPNRTNRRLVIWVGGPLAAAATVLLAVAITQFGPNDPERSLTSNHPRLELETVGPPEIVADEKPQNPLELLKKGDVFGILDPDGNKQFDLIVLARPLEPDTIVCILVGQEPSEKVTEPEPLQSETLGMASSSVSIEADQSQLDQLRLVLKEANTLPESAPVVDIVASGEMARQMMAGATLKKRARELSRPQQDPSIVDAKSATARTEPPDTPAGQTAPQIADQRRSSNAESGRSAKLNPSPANNLSGEKLATASEEVPALIKSTEPNAVAQSRNAGQLGRYVIQNIESARPPALPAAGTAEPGTPDRSAAERIRKLAEADNKELLIGRDFDKSKLERLRPEALLRIRLQK